MYLFTAGHVIVLGESCVFEQASFSSSCSRSPFHPTFSSSNMSKMWLLWSLPKDPQVRAPDHFQMRRLKNDFIFWLPPSQRPFLKHYTTILHWGEEVSEYERSQILLGGVLCLSSFNYLLRPPTSSWFRSSPDIVSQSRHSQPLLTMSTWTRPLCFVL